MANSGVLADTLPLSFDGGVGPVYEYELNLDTINTDYTIRTGTAGERIAVVGLLLNQNSAATVTLKSGTGQTRATALTQNSPLSGYLYFCRPGEDLKIQSTTTSTSLIVRVIEMNFARLTSTLSMGSAGGGSGGGGISEVDAIYNSTAPSLSNGQEVQLQCDASGSLKMNGGSYGGTPVQTNVSVNTSSTTIISANSNRTMLAISNSDLTNPIFIRLDGATATASNGHRIAPGGYWESPPGFIVRSAVTGIATGAACNVVVSEGN